MDRLSFSDDTDDSFPSQNLRDTIDYMSRRLDVDSSGEMTQTRYFSTEYHEARGAPDGQTTSIYTATNNLKSPATSPPNAQLEVSHELRKNFGASSSTMKPQEELVPGISSDEPVDLSNGPLDLRTKMKTLEMECNTLFTSGDSLLSNSRCHAEKTVDSFDSMLLLPKSEAYFSSHGISLNETSSSTYYSDELATREELAEESKDVTYAILSSDIVRPIIGHKNFFSDLNRDETFDAEGTTYYYPESNITTVENDSLCNKSNEMNSIVSKEIACTVQSIVPMNDTLPSLYSNSSSACERLNQTYDVKELSQNISGLTDVSHHPDGASVTFDDTALLPMEVEPDSKLINEGASASCFATENQNEASSSSVSEHCLDNTVNTNWSVKKALKPRSISPGSSLKLTFTRTPNNKTPHRAATPLQFQALDSFPVVLDAGLIAERSFDSAHSRRVIAGSSSYSEESTIFNESSQVVPFRTGAYQPNSSCPGTPDITLQSVPRCGQNSPRHTFPAAHVGETSTPNDKPSASHSLGRTVQEFSKNESLRRLLLRQRMFECQDSDSILNLGFRMPSDESKSSKMKKKKKSLLKNLKRQFFCSKETNQSVASLAHKSDFCRSSSNSRTKQAKRRSVGRQILSKLKPHANLPRCINNMDDSCPTTLFATITDSSAGLTSWCRHIRDITRIPIDSEQVVPELQDNTTTTPARTELRTSTKYEPSMTAKSRESKKAPTGSKSSMFFDHLQPLTNHHHGTNTPVSSACLEDMRTKPTIKVRTESCENNKAAKDFKTPKNHPKSMPRLHNMGTSEISDELFKKPDVPSKKRISSSKSAPSMRTSRDVDQSKSQIKPKSSSQLVTSSKPLSSSTPFKPVRKPQQSLERTKGHDINHQETQQKSNSLDTSDVRIKLISEVGRRTAEWLATFVGDVDSKVHHMRCDEQPNRNVLLQLCSRCKIRVQWLGSDSSIFRLKKTKETRAPTESDLRHLIRALRRNNESTLL